ncbi:glycosyltransferase family 2 protein [Chloroflexota bacterium]
MYKGKTISIVIPVYNEEDFIVSVINNVPNFVDRIYIVDDGSPDRTVGIVKTLNHSLVTLIQHETNHGPGAALSTGYQAALEDNMDIVVKIDGDDQMPSDQIENLIMPIVEGKVDYTKGDRLSSSQHRRGMPRFRLFGNLLLTGLTRIASGCWHLSDSQNGFTAISKKALETVNLNLYPCYGYLNDLLIQLNVHHFKVSDVPMLAKYGKEKSSIRLKTYIPKISLLLLTRFLWRLRMKYF